MSVDKDRENADRLHERRRQIDRLARDVESVAADLPLPEKTRILKVCRTLRDIVEAHLAKQRTTANDGRQRPN